MHMVVVVAVLVAVGIALVAAAAAAVVVSLVSFHFIVLWPMSMPHYLVQQAELQQEQGLGFVQCAPFVRCLQQRCDRDV